MKVVVDERSGFCPGVVKAIEMAENGVKEGRKIASLGDLMHNKVEMNRLKELGLSTINHSSIESVANGTLLIRAHGEPPATYEKCKQLSIEVIDATCRVVSNLQKIVANADREMAKIGGQVVILGKHGHPEVVGLVGQISLTKATVVESLEELQKSVDFEKPIYFLSQTTKSLTLFNQASELLLHHYHNKPSNFCTIKDTICRQVSNRTPHLEQFASEYDVILFVAGADSSNGKALFETCSRVNPNSYKIEEIEQIKNEWFWGKTSVGVCGATSTPRWQMDRVAQFVTSTL